MNFASYDNALSSQTFRDLLFEHVVIDFASSIYLSTILILMVSECPLNDRTVESSGTHLRKSSMMVKLTTVQFRSESGSKSLDASSCLC